MTNIIKSIQIIEDNGGGLHMACFDADDQVINYFSGFENSEPGTMEAEVMAAMTEGVSGWDGDAEDCVAEYDQTTGYQYGWKVVAEHGDNRFVVYSEKMGNAAQRWSGIDYE